MNLDGTSHTLTNLNISFFIWFSVFQTNMFTNKILKYFNKFSGVSKILLEWLLCQ